MKDWVEEITFSYTCTNGDEAVHRITRGGGITLDAAYSAFDQFLRGVGYVTDETSETMDEPEKTCYPEKGNF